MADDQQRNTASGNRGYGSLGRIPAPDRLPVFPDARLVRAKTRVNGRLLKRWKDDRGIYEWDHLHGTVEVYDLRGRHQCEVDPETGRRLKGANSDRRIEP